MIQTIERIDRVGTLHGLDGSAYPLAGLSLIYAVNGCGKSTLAAILAAAGSGDGRSLDERRSLGTTVKPHVRLLLVDGSKRVLNGGQWSGAVPRTHVFDTQFVDQNVHKGGEVSPSHRQGLLSIVIGQTAVQQQEALEAAQVVVAAAKVKVEVLEREVTAMAHAIDPGIAITVFERLPVLTENDSQVRLSEAEAALTAGRNLFNILNLSVPVELNAANVDLTDLFEALGEPLSALHGEARRRVAEHTAHIDAQDSVANAESWLRAGVAFGVPDECPFCGQSTVGLDLIDLYAEFFDSAYGELRDRLDRLRERLDGAARERVKSKLVTEYERANVAAAGWGSHVSLPPVPELRPVLDMFDRLGTIIDRIISIKLEHFEMPLDAPDDEAAVTTLAREISEAVENINAVIRGVRVDIGDYKRSLAAAELPQLERELAAARLTRLRGGADVIRLLAERAAAKKELRQQERAATEARDASKVAMNQILANFETAINDELGKMGAQFKIEKVAASFAGGTSRGNYGLNLRGTSIDVSNGLPPFRLALSEGDKRTLAFAFFCSTVLRGQDLRGHVVVVDDPVTSLDAHRRRHTTNVLNEMSLRGAQVIVLAHDATYLRDVRNSFKKKAKDNYNAIRTSVELQLVRSGDNNSSLRSHDLDRECESSYFRHYRLISKFVSGEADGGVTVGHAEAASAIRPLIEGYLHRRFPGRVPEKTLGAVIVDINASTPPDVLFHAKTMAAELSQINDWAAGPHHDTQSDFATQAVDPQEVRAFAIRALKVVHGEP
ncbi:vitamin B12-transporter ATPase [Clavibacter michiganensis subsp. michiganensis]|uniref:AAA family ATPase n=1 Tax=Clavibacter michiganensis TaxID=28447 RepID=UPI000B66090C|nr:AAA family ATPase [Clavibacter michiganensis]MDO4131590.1 AAA family ATPase [Clavibacter michiganensis]OUD98527.1 vitamin B12-transporter ATPase [Clavibacter michiganensis subsp. michiganensis]OUE03102.1 vitamin B12-transporter ATPase [Clavibacter michiganensis subsp. michiganensis]